MDADERSPDDGLPRFDFNALARPGSWAAPRPVHPDGTPAPGAFDPRSWWPRYQHRFAAVTGRRTAPVPERTAPVPDRTAPVPDRTAAEASPTMTQTPAEQRLPARRSAIPGRTNSAADMTDDVLLPPRSRPPVTGWRAALYAATGGRYNPGPSDADLVREELLTRIRRHLPGGHHVAVSSMKGGVGKTTVSAVLGLTLAEHRGDRVVAVDANPDAGTLADRLTGEIGVTVRQMLDNLDSIDSMVAVSHYTSLAGRLQVLASEQDPAMSEAFNRDEYERICAVLARFFNIIITDSGTGLVHSAMEGTLALADSLIVVGSPTVDGASRASKTLDWLVAHGYAEQVAQAIVVLSGDRVSPVIDREAVRAHFRPRVRAVVEIPYDPHLVTGGLLDLDAMRPATRDAFLGLGALVADRFSS
jgi:MinD-like ATPase involved in chromosome partitioning or flagellar assembly